MKGFLQDIERLAVQNEETRRVLYTAQHCQLVVMASSTLPVRKRKPTASTSTARRRNREAGRRPWSARTPRSSSLEGEQHESRTPWLG